MRPSALQFTQTAACNFLFLASVTTAISGSKKVRIFKPRVLRANQMLRAPPQ
jgi:hypothetical protein